MTSNPNSAASNDRNRVLLFCFETKSQTDLTDMNTAWLSELGERREKEIQFEGMRGGGESTRFGSSIWFLLL